MRTAILTLLLAAGVAAADPPSLTFPATTVKAQKGEFVVLRAETPGKWVRYKSLTPGLSVFPSSELKNPKNTVVTAPTDGTYRMLAWTGNAEEGGDPVEITIVVGGGKADPDPEDPDPKDPPPVPTKSLYFLVVRPDGPASPAFTRAMSLPEWATLRAAGHSVKDRTATEAAGLGVVVPASALPAVVTLREAADGKTSSVVRPAVPLPMTGAGVLDLPKGVN